MQVLAEIVGEPRAVLADEALEAGAHAFEPLEAEVGGAGDGRGAADRIALAGNVDLELDRGTGGVVAESPQQHAGGGKSEVGYLNGAVARYGGKTGVDTPVNSLLNEILQALTDGSLPRDSYAGQADKLLAALD